MRCVKEPRASRLRNLALPGGAFLAFVFFPAVLEGLLHFLFPTEFQWLYPRETPAVLAWEHLRLVAVSSGMAALVGVLLGIGVTRKGGRPFLPAVEDLVALGQTFPPVAVLALAVPAVGFGFRPALLALFIYGILPVARNAIDGLESVPGEVVDAARGIGMEPLQVLLKVELPLALPVILAGVRTSVVINVGTATIGATIGAGGLGVPIIAGLIGENPAYVLEGALLSALMAIFLDRGLGQLSPSLCRGSGEEA